MGDSLFDLEKRYYLGDYESCISKANSMPASRESIYYLCLSNYHLKKYDILEFELKKSNDECVTIIKTLLDYTTKPNKREAIVEELNSMLDGKTIDAKDDLSRIVISSIFAKEKLYSSALKVLNQLESLPAFLAHIGIYLLMNRVDLAERSLKRMQAKDDFSTLTLLAVSQVRLASGNFREAYETAKGLEDKFGARPLLKNIQTAAAINMGNTGAAKEHCEMSLDMDSNNLEALINMIYIMSNSKASNEVKERNFARLKALYPEHEYVKEFDRLDVELVDG